MSKNEHVLVVFSKHRKVCSHSVHAASSQGFNVSSLRFFAVWEITDKVVTIKVKRDIEKFDRLLQLFA